MRAGLSTIQQTLTPEAASVLNHSIAEAGRRNHGQTTPLHVAATLLSAPSGFLRQACIRSHPNSSHPLQCRALELCFSVALERLPTAQNMAPGMEPPISNALMAALKRAQAHQRRGCPEQQQQPLLAVKVELEQLIISILDDPSVSRVMREASFSSPAVKATIEQSLNSTSHHHHHHPHHQHHPGNVSLGTFGGIGPRMLTSPIASPSSGTTPSMAAGVVPLPNRNMYVNPKLQQATSGPLGNQRNEEVKKVFDILMRSKKRNPVLVGESEPDAVVKELFKRIEKGDLVLDGPLKNVQVMSIEKELLLCDKNQIAVKINELGNLIESRINDNGGGVILDLGDLKWLVEQPVNLGGSGGVPPQQQMVSDTGKEAVLEMGKLLARFSDTGKIWLIGTATYETYLRCQVYHSSMENDWDLQTVSIASRSSMPGIFPRLGSSMDPLNTLKSFPSMVPAFPRRVPEKVDPPRRTSCCPQCLEKYEEEVKLLTKEFENVSSENKSEAAKQPAPLPLWLQNAKLNSGEVNSSNSLQGKNSEVFLKQKTQELQKKWNESCLNLHPHFHKNVSLDRVAPPPPLPAMSLYNPKLLAHQPLQPKLPKTCSFGETLSLNTNKVTAQALQRASTDPPCSPVRTELALGRKVSETCPEKTSNDTQENQVKDFLSCISTESQTKFLEKFANALDADTFKKLLKGLMEKAWWQSEAASAVASAVTKCRLGNGKRRGSGSKGDIWLLFTGPDRIGKRKMASVLSEQICGTNPVTISLGLRRDDAELDTNNTNIRGKTALDRIAEAVRRNPFSVIVLEDIDEADMLVRGSIRRAMDRGRLTDSHGREISLGNVIFILTGNWSSVGNVELIDEKRLAGSNWQLKLTVGEREQNAKRRAAPIWLQEEERSRKAKKDSNSNSGMISFDLNLAAAETTTEDDRTDVSYNSSDLTIDHEEEQTRQDFSITSVPHELVNSADETIVFKPVDLGFIRREIKKTICAKFCRTQQVDDDEEKKRVSIQIEEDAIEKIIGGIWHGRSSLEEWVEKALTPRFEEIKTRLPLNGEKTVVVQLRLEVNPILDIRSSNVDWLQNRISVTLD